MHIFCICLNIHEFSSCNLCKKKKIIMIMFIKILDWQFTIVKIEIEKLKFTIDDKYMAYI